MIGDIAVFVAAGRPDLLAGRLYSQGGAATESASFAYDSRFLASPGAYALDPALPLVTGTLQAPAGPALFGAFGDSLPDRWGRTLIQHAEQARARAAGTAPHPISETDLLLSVRDDLRQGALRFRLGEQGPFLAAEDSRAPALTDLPALLDIAARVEQGTADYDDLTRLRRAGSSLGGARPKAHVLNATGRLAIAKFPNPVSDTWNVMAWEKVALDLARDAGLTVPHSQLIRIGDRHVLIVERFDRRGAVRVGYASARTMLEAHHHDQRSYLEIAAVIEERSAAATADLRQLWRRMAFSVLISNTDDHLRNHGFLHEHAESWALSPAFDLNPNPGPGPKYLSTAIDSHDTRASVQTLMSVADYFRLTASDALDILTQVTRAAADWRRVAQAHGLRPPDLDDMEPAFEHAEAEQARALTTGRSA
jgi:serine/threonine-protein kinase HipA